MVILREILQRIGARQKDLAEATGLSEAEISRTLKGERDLKVRRTVEILAFLNRPEHLARLGRSEAITFEELFGSSTKEAA